MFALIPIVLSLGLLAFQTLAAPNAFEPSKHVGWTQTPRTLQDPDVLKRGSPVARGVGFSPFDKNDIFRRQGGCSASEVTCPTGCCPAGYACTYTGGVGGCCPVGHTCTGPPVGCADPTLLECPASIGGCCPVGQACYRDSAGVAHCNSGGLTSTSRVITTPTYTPPATTRIVTVTTSPLTYSSVTIAAAPVTVTVPASSPAVTVKGGSERRATGMGMGALAVMVGVLAIIV